MNQQNEQTISRFYVAFDQKDHRTMQSCYSEDVDFFDPVFGLLKGKAVFAMWEMLCKSASDLSISYDSITDLGENYYNCNWTATYTYSPTGRKVVNKCKAYMKIRDGVIIEHSDGFSLHAWAKQAYGFTGWLFGWNVLFQRKIRSGARKKLESFIEKNSY